MGTNLLACSWNIGQGQRSSEEQGVCVWLCLPKARILQCFVCDVMFRLVACRDMWGGKLLGNWNGKM